jgi:hypothetical protein
MVAEIDIGRSTKLTGFDVNQLDPLPLPLSLDGLLGVVASEGSSPERRRCIDRVCDKFG